MKTIVAIALALAAASAFSQAKTYYCGYPPFAPYGMYYVCVCDANGNNCQWVLVQKR